MSIAVLLSVWDAAMPSALGEPDGIVVAASSMQRLGRVMMQMKHDLKSLYLKFLNERHGI